MSAPYQLFALTLSLFALLALALQAAVDFDPEVRSVLTRADDIVCLLFLVDFLLSWFRAPNRTRYLVTVGWLDLISSIPALDIARWGRAVRVLRILRVLRALRATRLLAKLILERRAESTFLAATLLAILLVVVTSMLILQFEVGPGANIRTGEEAIWWAFTTITTVGYGDRYPVTSEGRFVAVVLMSAGVGLFGTFSGFLAAWFLEPEVKEEALEMAALRREIASLRQALEAEPIHS